MQRSYTREGSRVTIIEYVGCDGSFRNTTVRGAINGEALDLGIIDDPIKGREEANTSPDLQPSDL